MSSFYEQITVDTIARALNIEENKYILQNIAHLKKQKDNILQKISNHKKSNELEIKIEAGFLGRKLGLTYVGMGDVSVVYQDKTTKKVFKILYNFSQIENEIESLNILEYLKGNNYLKERIVFHIEYVETPTLIVEYPWCESLFNIIHKKKQQLSDKVIINGFDNLYETLKTLHEKGIYHQDIKTDNIAVCNGFFKLNDFGFAKNIDRIQKMDYKDKYVVDLLNDYKAKDVNDLLTAFKVKDVFGLLTAYVDCANAYDQNKWQFDDSKSDLYQNLAKHYKVLTKTIYIYPSMSGGKRRNRRRRTRRKRNTKQKKRSRRSKRSKKTT